MSIVTIKEVKGVVQCNEDGSAEHIFNVKNTTETLLRIGAQVTADVPAKTDWLSIQQPIERDLDINTMTQIIVNIQVPPDCAADQYSYHLVVYDANNPGERFTKGETVYFHVPVREKKEQPESKKKYLWLIPVIAISVLVVIGLLTWLLWPSRIEVPNVVGKPIAQAKNILGEAGLAAGSIESAETNEQSPGNVLDQDPDAGDTADKGQAVNLVVAKKPVQPVLSQLCLVSGLIKSGGWATLGTLPDECRPDRQLIFNLNNHERTSRVDVRSSGEVIWQAGGQGHDWISLTGIVFKQGTGGSALTLRNGWVNYGDQYRRASIARVGELCIVSGLIKAGGWGTLAMLPSDCRPDKRLIFNLNNHGNTSRVDVFPNGEITWFAGGKQHGWISLDGIIFKRGSGGKTLTLINRWTNYGSGYRGASVAKVGDLCLVSGLIKDGVWSSLAALPEECRPDRRLIFNLNNHQSTARVDVNSNGEIAWEAGGRDHGWISLDGIVFKTGKGGNAMNLQNRWVNYGGGYRGASVVRLSY
jgi:hypothetical protein